MKINGNISTTVDVKASDVVLATLQLWRESIGKGDWVILPGQDHWKKCASKTLDLYSVLSTRFEATEEELQIDAMFDKLYHYVFSKE